MPTLWGQDLKKNELRRRVGDMRQICGAQSFELTDGAQRGTRGVRLYNAAGLDLDVLMDRGMGIGRLTWQGIPLALQSAMGAVHPAFCEHAGLGWLRTWPAGFLTTCGLSQVGSPNEDNGEELGQHGRAAAIPAANPVWGGAWQGEEYTVSVSGQMRETAFFGLNLLLTRQISLGLDANILRITDTVVNEGFAPAPHMYLQHFNLGFPLIDEGTVLKTSGGTVSPRDEISRQGFDKGQVAEAPVSGRPEEVFYHELHPDGDGMVWVSLFNPKLRGGKGLRVTWRYSKDQYPVLVQWKNMTDGLYVMGVEPANCHVGGRSAEREAGTLVTLEPDEQKRYVLEVIFGE